MVIRIFLIFCFLISLSASACELAALPFGMGYGKLAEKYPLRHGEYDAEGRSLVHLRATMLCSDLPANYTASFVMQSDQLIGVVFSVEGSGTALFHLAEKEFAAFTRAKRNKEGVLQPFAEVVKRESPPLYASYDYSLQGERLEVFPLTYQHLHNAYAHETEMDQSDVGDEKLADPREVKP
jgi:hypothetical protein